MKTKTLRAVLILILAAIAGTAVAVAAGPLKLPGEQATEVGIYIKNLSTGKVLAEQNASVALTPASVMKALTSATALSICGADTCFTTTVGLTGTGREGVWHGNLEVRASADPTLESDYFKSRRGFCDSIAAALKKRGVKRIEGGIVVDSHLSNAGPNVQWEVEDIAWPYGAALFGFNYRDNTVTVTPATGATSPAAPGLEVCVEPSSSDNIVRGVYSDRLMVFSKNPADRNKQLRATVPNPSVVFEAELRRTLSRAGISVGKSPVAAGNDRFTAIYRHRSPRFGEIMRSLMVRSDNLFAEGMLRAIAPGSSRGAAISREKKLWDERGVDSRYTTICDGSGLARANRLSPKFLAGVLEWMAKSPLQSQYTAFFPRAGKEGTLRGFLAKSKLAGKIALKTGSVGGVQCYAGYKLDAKGRPTHVIVIMVNGFFCPRKEVRQASERLLTKLFL